MPLDFSISPARPADAPAIAALLREAGLPDGDVAAHTATFLVARDVSGRVVGAVGAEPCGSDALLRSLVVAPSKRGRGLGLALMEELERAAGRWGVERWWLLTTTAEDFLSALGFKRVGRETAPAAIRGTGQFSGGCCASAVCMSRLRNVVP